MKKILSLTLILICTLQASFAQEVDRSKRPEAGPAPTPQIEGATTFTLDNGLKIFVVENSKLPRVSMSLMMNTGPMYEAEKAGYLEMMGELMQAGTASKTKAELDEEVDFMGASLGVGWNSVYVSSLSKYNENMMAIMADVILNPGFREDEFEKIKTQMLSGIESSKDDPNSINSQVYNALVYGKENAFGEFITEETVNAASVEDAKAFYSTYWKPNISYIAIVGNIKAKKAKKMVEKYLGSWQMGEVTRYQMETPALPAKTNVALVNRDASVQSVVKIGNRIVLKPGDADIAAMSCANQILGGGMNGRLFTNLREDKAFTYGAYSGYGTNEYVSNFAASAEVRNEVTDSAVAEFLYEINRIRTEDVTERELSLAKSSLSGSFGRSLESPSTLASFAINIERYSLPADYYQNYLTRLEAVTIEDIKRVANKYMAYDNLTICITGKAIEVGNLAQFGEVVYYDMYANVTEAPMMPAPEGVTANMVVENFLTAVGGKEAISKIKTMNSQYDVSVSGVPMTLQMQLTKDVTKGYMYMGMAMNGEVMQKSVYNGKTGFEMMQGQKMDMDEDKLKEIDKEARTI
ncbi:MAG: insulinase family protein, partial [Schleiferiaceae bacterium]|nr:insulinase family protein [Schleiferiaceae bacterium]